MFGLKNYFKFYYIYISIFFDNIKIPCSNPKTHSSRSCRQLYNLTKKGNLFNYLLFQRGSKLLFLKKSYLIIFNFKNKDSSLFSISYMMINIHILKNQYL